MGLTMKQIDRIELIYNYLSPTIRQKAVQAGDLLAELEEKLNSMDMGCAAFKIAKALGELLDEPVVAEKVD